MTSLPESREAFGRRVLGPIVAEFCMRLWLYGSLLHRADDTTMLFCARGGLRLHLAYERFLKQTGLPSPVDTAPLMVSRLAVLRPSLLRTVDEGLELLPGAASALSHEFVEYSTWEAAVAVAGTEPANEHARWHALFDPAEFAALLHHRDGAPTVAAVRHQSELFVRHLDRQRRGRQRVALVDTGLYGTTRALLAEGAPGLEVSSPLMARAFRPGTTDPRAFGLTIEASGYTPVRRRTTLLRYWHFVEWFFEPELASVRSFDERRGEVVSNLEIPGWLDRVEPVPGTTFHGAVSYLDSLGPDAAQQIDSDAELAWEEFRRAVVWPDREHADILAVGTRSHDFGLDGTWTARSWQGPVATLRGSSMWREGEAAFAGPFRRPLLVALEAAHGLRSAKRFVAGRTEGVIRGIRRAVGAV